MPAYRLITTWGPPRLADVDSFEADYQRSHLPLAEAVPHVEHIRLTKMVDGIEGEEPAFYRVGELVFADQASVDAALASPEWRELIEDGGKLVERYGVAVGSALGLADS